MIPAGFDYVRPASVEEAVGALAAAGEEAKLLAGGQSLLPLMRLRLAYPETIIDLDRVPSLREIREEDGALFIGAMATHHQVTRDPLVRAHAPLIAQAAATVADPAVRHRGTFGGSLAHADAAGDLPASVLALDGTFVVRSARGAREIAAAGFFVDWLTSALEPDEMLLGVRIPKLAGSWRTHYEKFHRTAQAWAIVGVACAVRTEGDVVADARVALTNMAPVPVRASAVESAIEGRAAEEDVVRSAARSAADGVSPPSDLHGSAEYRKHLAQVLTGRALMKATAG